MNEDLFQEMAETIPDGDSSTQAPPARLAAQLVGAA